MLHQSLVKKFSVYFHRYPNAYVLIFLFLLSIVLCLLNPIGKVFPILFMPLKSDTVLISLYSDIFYVILHTLLASAFTVIIFNLWEAVEKRIYYYIVTGKFYTIYPNQGFFNEALEIWLKYFIKALKDSPGIDYKESNALSTFAKEVVALRELQKDLKLSDTIFPIYAKKLPFLKTENYHSLTAKKRSDILSEIENFYNKPL